MLIKTEVKRRTQALNQYILNIKQKVYQEQLREAKQLLKMSRDSINNSYMAPYDPNSYLLDSLKTKNQKLRRQKDTVQQQIANKLEDINRLRLRRGFINHKTESTERDFIIKIYAQTAGAYVSRLTLKLQDVDRIDYEVVSIQTDYRVLKVKFEDVIITIDFGSVISVEAQDIYILICWKAQNQKSINFMMIRFQSEEERKLWLKCINFSKLICESQMKSRLFFKEQKYSPDNGFQGNDNEQEITQLIDKEILNKIANLTVQANKTSAIDRLRRKSQMYQNLQIVSPSIQIPLQNNNLLVGSKSKLRKVSEDLSAKQGARGYFYDKRSQNQKSRKSFGNDSSPDNSVGKKKQQSNKKQSLDTGKRYEGGNTKIERLIEEREKYSQENKMNQSTHSQSNRQIFFNETSSIHWIEQEKDETNSKQSSYSKNTLNNKKNFLEVLRKQNMLDKGKKIYEVPAQGEQSPLLISKKKGRNFEENQEENENQQVYQLRIKEVDNPGKKNSSILQQTSEKLKKQESVGHQKRRQNTENQTTEKNQPFSKSFEFEQTSEVNQILQQASDDGQSQPVSKNPDKSQTHLEIQQQKSQDLLSQNQKSQTQSKKYELDYLISGIVFLKCSKDGWNPHLKKVHLSNNHSQLCWKNLEGDDLKKINLSDIEGIEYNPGSISPGIKKHIKNIEKRRCIIIKYLLKKQTKFLQFYLPEKQKIQEIENFYQKLDMYFKFKSSHSV